MSQGIIGAKEGFVAKANTSQDLLPLVYHELRKLAAARMALEREAHTLQPTALVHEVWLRLASSDSGSWASQSQFFSAAAEAMRRVLIDRARQRNARKRVAGTTRIDLDQVDLAVAANEEVLLSVNEALEKLAAQDSLAAELVKLRFFIGLNYEEAARTMGISERTAKRCWTFARAWLYRELSQSGGATPSAAQRLGVASEAESSLEA